ncbi:type II secretion system F family protein [Cellulomonas sp. DKR-3]|uniref:Type II secretion system F family protein n=1 Tax=Cellulomonas fulva TaxID=2835530 RepID=A0ABS5U226_9CELL|nr:type II secretion system F family protein [Cellulomonas fulva]MBT0995461.1 type II secretion system F family protein [Cellulomonas fulva]
MDVVVGLLLGAGVGCVWWAFWPREPSPTSRAARWTARLQDELLQAGVVGVTPGGLLAASVALALVVLVVGVAVTRIPTIALFFAVFAAAAPVAVVRGRARRRQARLRQLWPEVVDHLASGIRAGLALPEALAQVGERGPVELRAPFRAFGEDYRATGRFSESLGRLKGRLADPVADRMVEALRITRDVGGTDLGRLLRTLSGFLRDDVHNANTERCQRRSMTRGHVARQRVCAEFT